jgi:acyl-coenzyme A synthetase/AMP-(fatty) acid ligase/succinyl-CoA synthetase alpha subunit/succinyl-CoA synthetase beta subunit
MTIKSLLEKDAKRILNKSLTLFSVPADKSLKYVVKVDQLVKRRGKQELVKLNCSFEEAQEWIRRTKQEQSGFTNFIVEEFIAHSKEDEHYFCILSEDDRDVILYSSKGGVDFLLETCTRLELDFIESDLSHKGLPEFLIRPAKECLDFFRKHDFTLLEFNPFIVKEGKLIALDVAASIDTTGNNQDFPLYEPFKHESEKYIESLDKLSGASLKFTLLNPNGKIWTFVAGGGASVVFADEVASQGLSGELANYGEYSGAPDENLMYEYSKTIFRCVASAEAFASKTICDSSTKRKVVLFGGAIAPKTNVWVTFQGILRALKEFTTLFKEQQIGIFVRRSGEGYVKALSMLKSFAESNGIYCEVYGHEVEMTYVIRKSIDYLYEAYKAKQVQKPLFTLSDTCIVIGKQNSTIQTSLDYDYKCGRTPSIRSIVFDEEATHQTEFKWGKHMIKIPCYKTISECLQNDNQSTIVVNLEGVEKVFESTKEILVQRQFRSLFIIAEGLPQRKCKLLVKLAREKGVTLFGPSSIGLIKPGVIKIASSAGSIKNCELCGLFKSGSVAYIAKSGGLSNELNYIISQTTDGVYEGVSIGGEKYIGSGIVENALRLNELSDVKTIVILSENGGTEEYELGTLIKERKISKQVVFYCVGSCADYFSTETIDALHPRRLSPVEFGHAGSSCNSEREKASAKNAFLKTCGAIVPDSFKGIGDALQRLYKAIPNIVLEKMSSTVDRQPQTDQELELQKIVSSLFGKLVTVSEDWFSDLGCNSITSSKLIKAIRDKFKCNLKWDVLYQNSTIEKMAQFVGSSKEQYKDTLVASGSKSSFLSSAQERVFWDELLRFGKCQNSMYNMSFYFSIQPEFIISKLNALLKQFEILRASFREHAGTIVQIIQDDFRLDFDVVDDVANVRKYQHSLATTVKFDLADSKPKILFRLVNGNKLVVVVHHIVFDGLSTKILKDFLTLPTFHPSPYQYLDWVKYENTFDKSDEVKEAIDWNVDYLQSCPGELQTDRQRTKRQGMGRMIYRKLGLEDSQEIDRFVRQNRVSLLSYLLVMMSDILFVHSGDEVLTIGSAHGNRFLPETENMIGMFVSTLVYKIEKSASDFKTKVLEIDRVSKEINKRSFVPYEKVLRRLNKKSLYQFIASLNFEEGQRNYLDFSGDFFVEDFSIICRNDLDFSLFKLDSTQGDNYVLSIRYAEDIFDESTVMALIKPETHTTIPETIHLTASEDFIDVILNNCDEFGEDEAIRFSDKTIRYSHLKEGIYEAIHFLQSKIKAKDVVVVSLQKSIEWIYLIIGIFYVGGIYCPVHPSDPRKQKIIDSVNPKLIIDSKVAKVAKSEPVKRQSESGYIITSSGSTGESKHIHIDLHSLDHLLKSMKNEDSIWTNRPSCFQMARCSFDPHISEILLPLYVGGNLIMTDEENIQRPEALGKFISQYCDVLPLTPSYFDVIKEHLDFTNLKLVMFGGESLQKNQVKFVLEKGCKVKNLYGPAECCINCLIWNPTPEFEHILLGSSLGEIQTFVLDDKLLPVEEGELYIAGPCLMKEYLNTCNNVFVNSDFGLIYGTKDIVKRYKDSYIFKGRKDFSFKHNGQMIYREDIERQIYEELSCKVVVTKENGTIFCYCESDPDLVIKWLSENVMVKMIVKKVEKFDTTVNGKIYRPTEEELEIKSVLESNGINVTNGQIELDSLSMIRAVNVINKLPGFSLEMTDLIECFTVKDLISKKKLITKNVLDLVLKKKSSDNVALIYNDQAVSYRQLVKKSFNVSKKLRSLGLKKDDIVIMNLPRGLEMIYSILGIMFAGGIYLPVHPDDSLTRIPNSDKMIKIDKHFDFDYDDSFDPVIDISKTAYIMPTSGTTGIPKLVCISHDSLYNLIDNLMFKIPLNSEDICSNLIRCSFDPHIKEIFFTLCSGSRLLIFKDNSTTDVNYCTSLIEKHKLNVVSMIPSIFRVWKQDSKSLDFAKNLKTIIFGGENLHRDLIDFLFDVCPEIKLFNVYGPTECTIFSTIEQVVRESKTNQISIGYPVPNTYCYVLDDTLQSCNDGELYIGGKCLMSGYLNDDIRTKESLINTPYGIMYKTGDRVVIENEKMFFKERLDHQIKLNGQRIETSDIELTLKRDSNVLDAFVTKFNDQSLAAFLILEAKASAESKILEAKAEKNWREWCKEYLPEFMIPSFFFTVDKFPITKNGKIDSKTLINNLQQNLWVPESEIEKKIYNFIKSDLGIATPSKEISTWGVTSLTALKTIKFLENENIPLKLTDLFLFENVDQLLHRL